MDCPLPLWPETQNCSGRGVACVSNECICQEGWTGAGDFVVGSPTCDIYISAIQGLWGFAIAVHCLSFLLGIIFLNHALYKDGIRKKMNDTVWKNVVCTSLAVACSGFIIATGALRIARPLNGIGSDPTVTVLFFLAAVCFWTFAPMNALVFISLNMLQLRTKNPEIAQKIKASVDILRKLLPACWVGTMVACVMPLFMMTSSDPTVMYGLTAVHYLAIAVTMISYIAVSRMVIRPLTHDIRQILHSAVAASSNGEKLRSVVWKFERIVTEITNQAVVQTILAGLFGLFPYVQRMASYQLPLAWAFTAPIMIWCTYATSSVRLSIPCWPSRWRHNVGSQMTTDEQKATGNTGDRPPSAATGASYQAQQNGSQRNQPDRFSSAATSSARLFPIGGMSSQQQYEGEAMTSAAVDDDNAVAVPAV